MKAFLPLNPSPSECRPLYDATITPGVSVVWAEYVPSLRLRAALRPRGSKTLLPHHLYLGDGGVQWFPAQLIPEHIRRISHDAYVQQRMWLLMSLNGYEPTATEVILRNGDIVPTEDWWAMLLAIGEASETAPKLWAQLAKRARFKRGVNPEDAQEIRAIASSRGRSLSQTPSDLQRVLTCFIGRRASEPPSAAYPRAGLQYSRRAR